VINISVILDFVIDAVDVELCMRVSSLNGVDSISPAAGTLAQNQPVTVYGLIPCGIRFDVNLGVKGVIEG